MSTKKIEIIIVTLLSVVLLPLIVFGFTIQIIGRVCIIVGAVFMINPISAKNEFKDLVDEIKDLWTKN